MTSQWATLSADLTDLLHLVVAPVAITFTDAPPDGVAPFTKPMPPALDDGRTGRVPAGCVFWIEAQAETFSTVAADHGNCSVGLMTHGFATLDDVAGRGDVAALLESGWVTMEMVPNIPVVSKRPQTVLYGPLAETPVDPDVILIRLHGRQLMVLSDALPGLRIEGKPQCHIVAVAKEQQEVAASVGCMLSRTRTGMRNEEMTAAIPGSKLADVVEALRATVRADTIVARYAFEDAQRFGTPRSPAPA